MNIVGIIFARTDSTRLPGKVLKKVEGFALIEYIIKRAKKIEGVSNLVLATTHRSIDDSLLKYARNYNLDIYRGELENVYERALKCAENYKADYFIRINADSPFLDFQLISKSLAFCKRNYDLITNIPERSFPYGISVEIIKLNIFKKTRCLISNEKYREHITKVFYENEFQYKIKKIFSDKKTNYQGTRLVVDTWEDLRRFEKMAKKDIDLVLNGTYQDIKKLYNEVL